MELETINRLYLELSQIATAKTATNLSDEALLRECRTALELCLDLERLHDLLDKLDERLK